MSEISIAISTYECKGQGSILTKYAIDSILMQTFDKWEIIVSDHSKDNNIKNYVEGLNNEKIKYYRYQEHYGSSSANTNNAISKSTSPLIKILFMDDYLYGIDALQKIVTTMNKNKHKMWLTSTYLHTNNRINCDSPIYPSYKINKLFEAEKVGNDLGCPTCLTIRKDVIERFDVKLKWLMDCDYYETLYRRYGEPIYLHEPTAVVFTHSNQVTYDCGDDLKRKEDLYMKNKFMRIDIENGLLFKSNYIVQLIGVLTRSFFDIDTYNEVYKNNEQFNVLYNIYEQYIDTFKPCLSKVTNIKKIINIANMIYLTKNNEKDIVETDHNDGENIILANAVLQELKIDRNIYIIDNLNKKDIIKTIEKYKIQYTNIIFKNNINELMNNSYIIIK